ncbi:MAG: PLP-dependent aminotransferase family protein [Fusobacterium gastrosuis]|uniref:MocR-like pyridoxine biosynthesis transcription factor PdxR n=1 Tax=Fusobacterium gastrosuis TaxID=1755100 RepID=UPI002A9CEB4A|nr:PLP-dependent aminotransferase family protein [Fusobacteriaceae bacterium]MDY5795833.1 PLP-dependent aminotransferase family protein [Fusobacterium gastrosuis]
MKILDINNNLKTPIYLQVYRQIREIIESGELRANQKLPSKKNLMETYKISQNTVQNALYLLLEEGYIYSEERKGYFVSDIENLIKKNRKSENLEEIIELKKDFKYDFSYSGVDRKSIPKTIFKKITKNIYDEEIEDLLIQGDIQGYFYLRKVITEYLFKSRGVKVSPNQIIVSSGLEYLFYIIFSIFKDKVYGMENPGYKILPQLFSTNNIKFKGISLDKNGIVIDEIKKNKVDIICVTPSHQFPSGVIMSVARRNELLNWANEREENYIIEDDYDSEFKYNGRPIQALKAIDQNDKVIYIGSFSKSISPSVRVSYMVLPQRLLTIYKEHLPYFICPVSTLTQKLLYNFIEKGYFEKHLNRMRTTYKKKREILTACIKEYSLEFLSKELEIQGADAGLHIVLNLPFQIDMKKFLEECEKNSLKIYSLKEYFLDEKKSNSSLLLGYASLDNEQIKNGIYLLIKLIEKYMNSK